MANPKVVDRMTKNIDEINRLVELLNARVGEYHDAAMHDENVNYGHVGDLYQIRTRLCEALNVEVKELD